MRSIDVKLRIYNYKKVCKEAELLCGTPDLLLFTTRHHDTFYKVNVGQLKMSKYGDSSVKLVRYEPVGIGSPSTSKYGLMHFTEKEYLQAHLLNEILVKCLGTRGTVKKERKLYVAENKWRIQLDRVENLGDFVKLKVILNFEQSQEDGLSIVDEILAKFDVKKEDHLPYSYIEMIEMLSCLPPGF